MARLTDPFILFIAGPNGSGKSTLINSILNHFENCNKKIGYLSPDNIAKDLINITDQYEKMRESQEIIKDLKYEFVSNRESFIIESVGSHPSHNEFLQYAKKESFSIATFFVTTDTPDINVERVANRVKDGGHDVPRDKIYSRYYKSMDRLIDYISVSDCILVVDNSSTSYEAVFLKNDYGCTVCVEKEYVKKYIETKLENLDISYEIKSLDELESNKEFASDLMNIFDEYKDNYRTKVKKI